MATTLNHLVTTDCRVDQLGTTDTSAQSATNSKKASTDESILDLSQRPMMTTDIDDKWRENSPCPYTDSIDAEFQRISLANPDVDLDVNQSLTSQLKHNSIAEHSVSDNSIQSQVNLYSSKKKINFPPSRTVIFHELSPCATVNSSLFSSNFLWSKYLSFIDERSVSEEFFDHYHASFQSGLQVDMKLEYCYDIQRDLYWLTQIQFVSCHLIRLHYVGIPEEDTSNDFWAYVYEQRCHPIGWCKENSKLMLPPTAVTKRAIQQTTVNNNLLSNGHEKQLSGVKVENDNSYETPPDYLFDRSVGLTPVEQLKVGMLLELQDAQRPWTLWFVRILNNQGGRLHLRYVTKMPGNNNDEANENSSLSDCDIFLFYLDYRVHPIGWTTSTDSIYSYDIPSCLTVTIDKQFIIDTCLLESKTQFLPPNLFKEQQNISKHRFTEGMKLEIFDMKSQNIFLGRIGYIHNEYYFDIIIDNEGENEVSMVSYSTDPRLLPAHWAAEHKLALMNGKSIRQSEDYWNLYTEKHGLSDLAPERCFNLITLNFAGNSRAEPGMKMEMIYTLNQKDYVFSVTIVHIIDHLMWLRVDNTQFLQDEHLFYHVVPINSLDVFPVGWAKLNRFELIAPIRYQMDVKTYEQNRYHLFSTVTRYPQIPRVYLTDVYLLTIYVNIRCFCGPHFCSSRLARIPSQFGPGPYRDVLIDMFHHLLSVLSTNAQRVLRRLDHQLNAETKYHLRTEQIKSAKRFSKLIRPISLPTDPLSAHHFLRHICTQLEVCPGLLSCQRIENHCPDHCHILSNTFAFSIISKNKRGQLRAAQNRFRRQKSLLCHLKTTTSSSNVSSPVVEEAPPIDASTTMPIQTSDTLPLPGSDRQTRGFRVYIEPKTHTITRTNKKQKVIEKSESSTANDIKQEPVEVNHGVSETSSSSTSSATNPTPIHESKRSRIPKKKRSLSPPVVSSSVRSSEVPFSSTKTKRNRRSTPQPQTSNIPIPKTEPLPVVSPLRTTTYSIPPPIDPRNPLTWNVDDVCWYLNECGCSFALKTIKEQEIDGAALLLLNDLDTVQDSLDFKLGPAVKFYHVVEQLRSQVLNTFHSSPSLKTSSSLSRFSTH
ncbi:unnamed protein product [Adineta ricciae]|uniref:SLED domain-containing protein n=1 Tax=Adineta ricciae TaxID=249248 RepID=A0A814HJ45_ADIRI|nr:unnamed protein product [Adineta ricciae]